MLVPYFTKCVGDVPQALSCAVFCVCAWEKSCGSNEPYIVLHPLEFCRGEGLRRQMKQQKNMESAKSAPPHVSPCKYKLGDTDTQFQGVQTPSSQVLLTYSKMLCSGTAPVYNCFRCLDFPMETRVGTGVSYLTSSHRRWQLKSEG